MPPKPHLQLADIAGQDKAIARLQAVLAGERMPHAYLFAGPDGVGRRTTALALAGTLLCEKPIEMEIPAPLKQADLREDFLFRQACGACADCAMLQAGSHPDLHVVYKELARYHEDANVRSRVTQDLGIAVIRRFLIAPAGRAASRARGKVFIILEAELMSTPAQNALLKTLEEPPDGVTIILICRRGEQMLPTTLSRCAIVHFGPLPREFVVAKLIEQQVERTEAEFWAGFTRGSVGRAALLSRQGMYEIKRTMLDALAAIPPGGDAELGENLVKVMEKLAAMEVADVKKADGAALSARLASRRAAGAMLELIASAFTDALVLATGADVPLVHVDQDETVRTLAERFSPTQLADVIEQLSEYERLLWRNVNPRLVWDNAVITCGGDAR